MFKNKMKKIAEYDKKHFWHPWSSNEYTHPIIIRGKSYYVFDICGKKYIDATSASLNASCGLGNRKILRRTYKQMKRLTTFDTKSFSVLPAIFLAKKISDLLPAKLCKTFFCNSGSEAVETAIKMAISYQIMKKTGKYQVMSFSEGYHGSTAFTSSLSGSLFIRNRYMDSRNAGNKIDLSKISSSVDVMDQSLSLLFNDDKSKNVAAFICEPVLGVGGFIFPDSRIIKKIYELCKANNIVFILDETFTSFGRTGKMFAFEYCGVVPDILITGKGISNAVYPLSAVTTTKEIYDEFINDPFLKGFRNGHTNSGHASACCAGIETIDYILKKRLVNNSKNIGKYILKELYKLEKKYRFIKNVRGLGLLIAFDVSTENMAEEFFKKCYNNGLIVRVNGKSIGIIPPLTINIRQAKKIIIRLSKSLSYMVSYDRSI